MIGGFSAMVFVGASLVALRTGWSFAAMLIGWAAGTEEAGSFNLLYLARALSALFDAGVLGILFVSALAQLASLAIIFRRQSPMLPVGSQTLMGLCMPAVALSALVLFFHLLIGLALVLWSLDRLPGVLADIAGLLAMRWAWPRVARDGLVYDHARYMGVAPVWGRRRGQRLQ